MFCSNCGHSLSGSTGKFCPNCGAAAAAQTPMPAATPAPKTKSPPKMAVILVCLIAVAAVGAGAFFLFGGGGGTELEGTWEWTDGGRAVRTIDIPGYGRSLPEYAITFRGNRFEAVLYDHISVGGEFGRFDGVLILAETGQLPAIPLVVTNNAIVIADRLTEENFGWIGDIFDDGGLSHRGVQVSASGTFSISDNTIELVLNDGSIQVFTFESTQNTLTFGRHTLHRR